MAPKDQTPEILNSNSNFNRKLLFTIALLSLVLLLRLGYVAEQSNNWPGFWYSSLHILIIAVVTYFIIREKK